MAISLHGKIRHLSSVIPIGFLIYIKFSLLYKKVINTKIISILYMLIKSTTRRLSTERICLQEKNCHGIRKVISSKLSIDSMMKRSFVQLIE